MTGTGATFGGAVGYNWQFNRTGVVGIEGDLDWANFREQFIGTPFLSNLSNKTDSFDTIRARFGLDVGGTLIYVTGGAAFLDRHAVGSFPAAGLVEYQVSDSPQESWAARAWNMRCPVTGA